MGKIARDRGESKLDQGRTISGATYSRAAQGPHPERAQHERANRLLLNGFHVEFPPEVEVVVRSMPDPSEVKAERERLAGHWFVHWLGGKLYCLRLKTGGPNVSGSLERVKTADHPWLLRARLDDVVANVFERYEAVRLRPFSFLAQRDEIVGKASEMARIRHPLLSGFRIVPKFTLNAKVIEPTEGKTHIGIFVTLGMRYEINAELAALLEAGVDLSGLYVVKRKLTLGERQLVGRVDHLTNGLVQLSEATGDAMIAAHEVRLEGSVESFSRCLSSLLGPRYGSLWTAIDDVEANFRVGPAFDAIVERMGEFLRRKSPVALGQGVEARIGKRLIMQNEGNATSVYTMPPVEYVFDRAGSKRHRYAWQGLQNHGPYDRATFAKKSPRILVVYPANAEGKVEIFLRALRDGLPSPPQAFPSGFAKLFGLVNPEFLRCPVRISPSDRIGIEAVYRCAVESLGEGCSNRRGYHRHHGRACASPNTTEPLHKDKSTFAHSRHSDPGNPPPNDQSAADEPAVRPTKF